MSDNRKNSPQTLGETRKPGALSRRDLIKGAAVAAPLGVVQESAVVTKSARTPVVPRMGLVGRRSSESNFRRALREHAAGMTIYDTHEHTWHEDDRLKKKIDFFLLLSHYTRDDLGSAGMPLEKINGLQNAEVPLETRWKDLAPFWPAIRTTAYGRCIQIAARDLFGVEEINAQTYQELSARMTAANRPGWYETVLKQKARIEKMVLDDLTASNGEPLRQDQRFFKLVARFHHFLLAKERRDLDHVEKISGVSVQSFSDLERALEADVAHKVQQGAVGIKISFAYLRDLNIANPLRADAERAFETLFGRSAIGSPDLRSQRVLCDYLVHWLMRQAVERRLVVQIHTGMLAGNQGKVAQTNPTPLTPLVKEYPQVRFDLFHGGYPYSSELATMGKNLPNVYPDLCWLHIIAPEMARRALDEFIETVPNTKILGFGGDFMHIEGTYGHAQMARAVTVDVLANKVESGYLKEQEATELMERILYRNGKELFG